MDGLSPRGAPRLFSLISGCPAAFSPGPAGGRPAEHPRPGSPGLSVLSGHADPPESPPLMSGTEKGCRPRPSMGDGRDAPPGVQGEQLSPRPGVTPMGRALGAQVRPAAAAARSGCHGGGHWPSGGAGVPPAGPATQRSHAQVLSFSLVRPPSPADTTRAQVTSEATVLLGLLRPE